MFENEEKIEVVDLDTMEETLPTEEEMKALEDLSELQELSAEELEEISGGRSNSSRYTYVKCTSHSVHIRASASAKSTSLGYLMHNQTLPYLGSYRNSRDKSLWYKVRSKKGIGYVTAMYTKLI